jgi:hypothetical protein
MLVTNEVEKAKIESTRMLSIFAFLLLAYDTVRTESVLARWTVLEKDTRLS